MPVPNTRQRPEVKLGSQASPIPSKSMSDWPGFATNGQLSTPSRTPSLSSSGSHASPSASPSLFSWPGFGTVGQLSVASGTPSLSESSVNSEAPRSQIAVPLPSPSCGRGTFC